MLLRSTFLQSENTETAPTEFRSVVYVHLTVSTKAQVVFERFPLKRRSREPQTRRTVSLFPFLHFPSFLFTLLPVRQRFCLCLSVRLREKSALSKFRQGGRSPLSMQGPVVGNGKANKQSVCFFHMLVSFVVSSLPGSPASFLKERGFSDQVQPRRAGARKAIVSETQEARRTWSTPLDLRGVSRELGFICI